MTASFISLLSIFAGIISVHVFAYLSKNKLFGFIGNTMIGVFGSIFLIKSFGRLGFAPNYIMTQNSFHFLLFIINMMVSALGGVLGFILAIYLHQKTNQLKK